MQECFLAKQSRVSPADKNEDKTLLFRQSSNNNKLGLGLLVKIVSSP